MIFGEPPAFDKSKAFFNEPLYRLRADRVQTIRGALRKHGLAFQPSEWPTPDTRVQIWPDASVVLNPALDKDIKFEALLQRWLEVLKLPPSSRNLDPRVSGSTHRSSRWESHEPGAAVKPSTDLHP